MFRLEFPDLLFLRARMGIIIDIHQIGRIDIGIMLGGGKIRVTQQFLDGSKIAAGS